MASKISGMQKVSSEIIYGIYSKEAFTFIISCNRKLSIYEEKETYSIMYIPYRR